MAFLYNFCTFNSGRFQASFWDDCCDSFKDSTPSTESWECGTVPEDIWQRNTRPEEEYVCKEPVGEAWQKETRPGAGFEKAVFRDTRYCKVP